MQSNSYRGGVLLVTHDDDAAARLRVLLEDRITLRRVASIADAKALLKATPQWAGVIIDLSRGAKGGLTLMGDIRKKRPEIPAAVMVV